MGHLTREATRRRVWVIAGIGLAATVVLLILPPIPQDPAYHAFADRREIGRAHV